MDAHTLNAWTRFALQKGGIGTCTALIDNPATDLEDLMFMTGEKIIILRRLDGGDNSDAQKSVQSGSSTMSRDVDPWFLGYCEGVVGRFRGSHVQIHGKLKKPVLMRRSGLGPLRESTTQPMSKSEAASMHVSQVPLGIPVTAVDSDGEEEADRGDDREADNLVDAYLNDDTASPNPEVADTSRDFLAPGKQNGVSSQHQFGRQANGLGISTPPLSDENHAKRHIRQASSSSTDSDDSDTRLPWARSSTSSSNKSSRIQSTEYTHETSHNHSAINQRLAQLHQKMDPHQLPPSPISSAESPIYPRNDTTVPPTPEFARDVKNVTSKTMTGGNRNRPAGQGHTSNQSSIATTNTSSASESDDESQHRRDQTFSIYDVYGRDSVAFPNFEFRNLNNRSPRIANSRSNDSLGRVSKKSPVLQSMAMRGFNGPTPMNNGTRTREDSASKNSGLIPSTTLRSPSGRRPTAAPAPPSIASTLRRKVEANASASSPVASSPSTTPNMSSLNEGRPDSGTFRQTPTQQHTTLAAFDPTRRPSLASRFAPRSSTEPLANSRPGVITSPDLSTMPHSPVMTTSPADMVPVQNLHTPQKQGPPLGANLLARRMQEASLSNRAAPPSGPLRVETGPIPTIDGPRSATSDAARSPGRMAASSDETIGRTSNGVRPPIRSSSDRSSPSLPNGAGRIGSGQLRKNPSNPQPGVFGGMTGLIAPQPPFVNVNGSSSSGGLSTPTGSSRSPSPLSAPSPSSPHMNQGPLSGSPHLGGGRSQMPASPVGSSTPRFPEPRVLSNAGSFKGFHGINPAALQFDPLGFVMGPKIFTMPMPQEESEELKAWRQIINENDVTAAKKNRKVKKMVHGGIPHSMRKTAWPFLASSHVRRRAGLFEELCKTSQSVKGRKGKESLYEAIDKDLDRAFPDHRLFIGEGSTGRADLEAILKAYVHYNPIVGYTQGMSLVAGFLLIQMPAEEAFWMLCALLRDVHMEGYYADNMKQLHVDGIVFGQLLQTMDSELADRLMEVKIEPINFAPSWLLPLFTRIVPWVTLLRLWDIFLFEGPSFLLRTALAVIRIIRDPLMDRRICPEGGEALRLLLHPPQHLLTPDNVIPCALSVKLKDGEVRKLSRQASKLVRSSISTRGAGTNSQNGPPPQSGRKS